MEGDSRDKPPRLKELLGQQGFAAGEPEALMVIELDERHPLLTREIPPCFWKITDEQGVRAIVALEDAVWGKWQRIWESGSCGTSILCPIRRIPTASLRKSDW